MSTDKAIETKISQYHEQAAAFAGYDNFGSPDDRYLEGLRMYLETAEREAELTDIGKVMLDQTVIGNLIGRLYAERGFEQHPQCLDQPVVKPIIVTGLARSGTTALHKVLASAPGTQSLEYWVSMFPMPRPPRETWKSLKEYQMVDQALADVHRRAPELIKMHPYGTEIPDECNRILNHSFMSFAIRVSPYTRTFGEWAIRRRIPQAFERLKKVYQLIGYGNSNRWVLKDPLHLPYIDMVLEQFPDACIVHIYREPGESMPSVASSMYTFGEPYQKNVDKYEYGRQTAEDYAFMMDRFMELRKKLNPGQFLDVSYTDLITHPAALAKRIYRHFGIDVGAAGEECFEQWEKNNQRDKFGKHNYTAEEYGLNTKMLNERFRQYRQQYLNAD